jgi:hypothetical protein
MHPLRLYFIISFFYFLIVSLLITEDSNNIFKVNNAANTSLDGDSLRTQIMNDVSKSLKDSGINTDSLNMATREGK